MLKQNNYRNLSIPFHSNLISFQKASTNFKAISSGIFKIKEANFSDNCCWTNGLSDIQKPLISVKCLLFKY